MTDYAAIRADDPGGTVADALAALEVMTEERDRVEHLITERAVYRTLGGVDGETFLQALATFSQGQDAMAPVVARVVSWLKPGEGQGVDICNAETQAVLNTLATATVLDQTHVDAIIALSKETVLKYPGLKYGDIEKARGQ